MEIEIRHLPLTPLTEFLQYEVVATLDNGQEIRSKATHNINLAIVEVTTRAFYRADAYKKAYKLLQDKHVEILEKAKELGDRGSAMIFNVKEDGRKGKGKD